MAGTLQTRRHPSAPEACAQRGEEVLREVAHWKAIAARQIGDHSRLEVHTQALPRVEHRGRIHFERRKPAARRASAKPAANVRATTAIMPAAASAPAAAGPPAPRPRFTPAK